MSDEGKLRAQVNLAQAWSGFVEGDTGLYAVIDSLVAEYQSAVIQTESHDTEAREAAYHEMKALLNLKRKIQAGIASGTLAAHELKAQSEIKQGKRKAFH